MWVWMSSVSTAEGGRSADRQSVLGLPDWVCTSRSGPWWPTYGRAEVSWQWAARNGPIQDLSLVTSTPLSPARSICGRGARSRLCRSRRARSAGPSVSGRGIALMDSPVAELCELHRRRMPRIQQPPAAGRARLPGRWALTVSVADVRDGSARFAAGPVSKRYRANRRS
jgi:hypothetical protein